MLANVFDHISGTANAMAKFYNSFCRAIFPLSNNATIKAIQYTVQKLEPFLCKLERSNYKILGVNQWELL